MNSPFHNLLRWDPCLPAHLASGTLGPATQVDPTEPPTPIANCLATIHDALQTRLHEVAITSKEAFDKTHKAVSFLPDALVMVYYMAVTNCNDAVRGCDLLSELWFCFYQCVVVCSRNCRAVGCIVKVCRPWLMVVQLDYCCNCFIGCVYGCIIIIIILCGNGFASKGRCSLFFFFF